MRIGVTGSSGFLGSHLTKALGQLPDAEAVILPRTSSGDFPGRDKLRSFVRDLDLIYHVAGVNRGTDDEILIGNIETTFNLVEAVKKSGKPSQRIVFASSSQVYEPVTQSGKVITESHKAEPATLFGVTKKTAWKTTGNQPENI
ncbi:MAG: NAD(P)-dependent oxidoreductase [Desulfobacterales bacterium]|jgi:UDP-2-acetamido-2,6-beta-L-arabino-hexul-4-ose reductase|nr:NAD(P)-dependent oxidoreductase [Desulfobacterales bacterium]|tara:strand:- start:1257 stop:1688 length:432 start_codon:yes stop_codon:yes gene_type:complete